MDIENREKALLQKNATISATSSPKLETKLPRRILIENRNRHPSDSSSSNTPVSVQGKLTNLYSFFSFVCNWDGVKRAQ